MKYRTIGKTNVQVSEIGLGCWAISGPYLNQGEHAGWSGVIDERKVIEALWFAIEKGVNHFDTADIYGYGYSERLISKVTSQVRNQVVIATKVGWVPTSATHVYDPFNIRKQCEISLKNLQTDYIDIYYLHHCDFGEGGEYLDPAIAVMQSLKQEGKIRCIGLSGYSNSDLISTSAKLQPDVIQSWADIEHDEFIRKMGSMRQMMDREHISFVAMMPFGQGRLLDKYSADNPPVFPDGDNRIGNNAFTDESLRRLKPRLNALKRRFGDSTDSLVRVALQFVMSESIVASVIPGFRDKTQVNAILQSCDGSLSDEDLAYILEIFPRNEMESHPWSGTELGNNTSIKHKIPYA